MSKRLFASNFDPLLDQVTGAPKGMDIITLIKNPGGTCSIPNYYSQAECEAGSHTWTPGASPTLPSGRYYDDALTYATNANKDLVVRVGGTAIPNFNGWGLEWKVGSDFFNPGVSPWMLDKTMFDLNLPNLVKTGGSVGRLGTPF